MYQAIVFLPLIGCIVAAVISLAGARARHPGGSPDATSHSHGAGHGGPAAHTAHDDHAAEPPAVGSREAELITTGLLFISMALSWLAFAWVGFGHHDTRIPLFTWMASGDFRAEWALRIDTLTAV